MKTSLSLILVLLLMVQAFAQETPEEPVSTTESALVQAEPAATEPAIPLVTPSIMLEAKVVQIVLNDEHRQGVDWEAIVSDFHTLQLRKDGLSSGDKKTLSVGIVSKEDYEVLLEALDTVGHVSQTDFPQMVINKSEPKSKNLTPDKGPVINFDLIWFSSPSGDPKLKITPGLSVNGALLKDQTEVDLEDSRTIVVGGLIEEEEIATTHKFPLLGNLPIVGLVFRKQGRLMQKTETIVFLTIHANPDVFPVPLTIPAPKAMQ